MLSELIKKFPQIPIHPPGKSLTAGQTDATSRASLSRTSLQPLSKRSSTTPSATSNHFQERKYVVEERYIDNNGIITKEYIEYTVREPIFHETENELPDTQHIKNNVQGNARNDQRSTFNSTLIPLHSANNPTSSAIRSGYSSGIKPISPSTTDTPKLGGRIPRASKTTPPETPTQGNHNPSYAGLRDLDFEKNVSAPPLEYRHEGILEDYFDEYAKYRKEKEKEDLPKIPDSVSGKTLPKTTIKQKLKNILPWKKTTKESLLTSKSNQEKNSTGFFKKMYGKSVVNDHAHYSISLPIPNVSHPPKVEADFKMCQAIPTAFTSAKKINQDPLQEYAELFSEAYGDVSINNTSNLLVEYAKEVVNGEEKIFSEMQKDIGNDKIFVKKIEENGFDILGAYEEIMNSSIQKFGYSREEFQIFSKIQKNTGDAEKFSEILERNDFDFSKAYEEFHQSKEKTKPVITPEGNIKESAENISARGRIKKMSALISTSVYQNKKSEPYEFWNAKPRFSFPISKSKKLSIAETAPIKRHSV